MKRSTLAAFLRPLDLAKRLTDRRYLGIKFDDAPPIQLQTSALQVADVFFCRGDKRTFSGGMISHFSSGQYVHAAIYLGAGRVAEATTDGVQACELAEFIERYRYVAVTRMPGLAASASMQNDVVSYCERHIAAVTPYNWVGAMVSPWLEFVELCKIQLRRQVPKAPARRERKRTFCSQFVLDAFISADEFLGYYLNSSARSPTALAEEYCFELAGYLCASGHLPTLVEDDLLWTGGG